MGEEDRVLLETRNLIKDFGKLRAVNSVNLTVKKGDIHAIIGPNGAGKTTFFNLVTGYHAPTGGQVIFKGRDITRFPPHRRCKVGITRSFQITSIFPQLTVYEGVLVGLLCSKGLSLDFLSKAMKFFEREVWEILQAVGLTEHARLQGASLSHGDKKRWELAITLATRPELLLLDEPTCGMSPEETESTMILIRKLAEERGLTILFTEHDMSVVFGIAKRITVFHMGCVIADGDPQSVRASEDVQRVYLGGVA
jgi:branched-chain amino acid transport system ATP-binding protein